MNSASGYDSNRFSDGRRTLAFSLVELVIVVVIIGIIAAIAVPRVSSATAAATSGSIEATIANVRGAVDVYFAERGRFPGYVVGSGAPDGAQFVRQLTQYSDEFGNTRTTAVYPYIYGPYLRIPFPSNPLNGLDSVHVKANAGDPSPADGTVGWVTVLSHGYFGISATNADLIRIDVDVAVAGQAVRLRGGA